MPDRETLRHSPPLWLFATCVPFIGLAILVGRYAFDVPYYDDWALLPLIEECIDGHIPWAKLVAHHNEHRPVLSKVILLLIALPTRWSTRWAEPAVLLFSAAAFGVWARAWLVASDRSETSPGPWLIPVVALLFFSPAQWHTWLTAWMLHSPMLLFFVFLALAALTIDASKTWAFPVALTAAFAATFTVASGLLVWPLGALALLLNRRVVFLRWRLLIWILTTILATALFFTGSSYTPGPLPTPEIPRDTMIVLRHACTFLGGPILGFDPLAAFVAGLLGLAALIYAALKVIRRPSASAEALLFFFLLAAFGISSAFLTAWGRALDPAGPAQAISSRYLTFAIPFWLGVLPLLMLVQTRPTRMALLIGIAFCGGVMAIYGVYRADERWDAVQIGRKALLNNGPDHDLIWLHPDPERLREYSARLKRNRLGLYNNRIGENERTSI